MPRISRFKRKVSDRSGFNCYEIEMVKDGAQKVSAEEYDTPPPSKISLGGGGDVSRGDMRSNSEFNIAGTETPTGYENPTVYITAAGGITASFTHPWMRVTGSTAAVTITADPQITRGMQGQVLTLQCVDSSITLSHATGINLMGSANTLTLNSGMVATFFYSTGGTVWNETSHGYY
jgi:hypothetical protein